MSDDSNDLSEYEKIRLANIKKNADFLAQLGLANAAADRKKEFDEKKQEKAQVAKEKAKRRSLEKALESVESGDTVRRSSRLSGVAAINYSDDVLDKADKIAQNPKKRKSVSEPVYADHEPGVIRYDRMPFDSDQLDSSEFLVYVALRKWRLMKARELDIETYKICQNRTLAELIRRRRNDENWARLDAEGNGDTDKMSEDLLMCWGFGPTRVVEGGSGWNLLMEINKSEELLNHLVESRQNGGMENVKDEDDEVETAE